MWRDRSRNGIISPTAGPTLPSPAIPGLCEGVFWFVRADFDILPISEARLASFRAVSTHRLNLITCSQRQCHVLIASILKAEMLTLHVTASTCETKQLSASGCRSQVLRKGGNLPAVSGSKSGHSDSSATLRSRLNELTRDEVSRDEVFIEQSGERIMYISDETKATSPLLECLF